MLTMFSFQKKFFILHPRKINYNNFSFNGKLKASHKNELHLFKTSLKEVVILPVEAVNERYYLQVSSPKFLNKGEKHF